MNVELLMEYIFLIFCIFVFVDAIAWIATYSLFKILDLFKANYDNSIRKKVKWQIFILIILVLGSSYVLLRVISYFALYHL
jgi:hypothetical protein